MSAVAGREAATGRGVGSVVALVAVAIGAFLLATGGALWLFAGEATFRAMVESGAAMFCL